MAISKKKLEEITVLHYEDVYKLCCSKLRNQVDAEDITHETFLTLYKNRTVLKDNNLRAYLIVTASNLIHEYFRKKQLEITFVSLENSEIDLPDNYGFGETFEDNFDELLSHAQIKIISALTPKEAELFKKLYIEKKSIDLVVDEMKINKNNAYVTAHNVRKKAKKIIFDKE